jgi:type II secretory pathway pseudopilin PulG
MKRTLTARALRRDVRRSAGSQLGLTLVEILVTIVLSALFFAALVPVFVMASQQTQTDRARVVATNAAQSTIERLRALPYGQLWSTDWDDDSAVQTVLGSDFAFDWKGSSSDMTISVTPYPSTATQEGTEDYMVARVSASWTGYKGKAHEVTVKTAIYRQGLGTETLVLLVQPLTGGYIKDTPVTVTAQLNTGDAAYVERIDFTVYANNGTRVEDWPIYTNYDSSRPDAELASPAVTGSPVRTYDHEWAATGPDGQPLADGRYTFVAKTIPTQPTDPDEVVPPAEWAQKEYYINRSLPGVPTVLSCSLGFRKNTPEDTTTKPFVYLQWKLEPNSSDIDHFEVGRTGVAADGSALAERTFILPKWSLEWVDNEVVAGATYTYRVGVTDLQQQFGGWSDPRSVTIATGGTGSIPLSPGAVTCSVFDRSITVGWGPSSSGMAVDAYRVYRQGADGVRLLVTTVGVDPGETDPAALSYMDNTVEYDATYTYFVTAVSRPEGGVQWESVAAASYPVHVPEPPMVGMKVRVQVVTGPVPTYARLMVHSLDNGDIIPANPWDYPQIDPGSSKESKNTWITGNILYPGVYEVMAVCYWTKGTLVTKSFTSDAITVSAPNTVVYVQCTGP